MNYSFTDLLGKLRVQCTLMVFQEPSQGKQKFYQSTKQFPLDNKKCNGIHNAYIAYIECVGRLVSLCNDVFNLIGELREVNTGDDRGGQEGPGVAIR